MLARSNETDTTEDPMVFHLNKPGFTRALLKNSKQALQILSPEATKKTEGQESSPFLEDDGEAPVSPDDPKIAFIVPEDRLHMSYIILYILGFGTLLPWNFFITANSYFKKKLEKRPDFQISFQNYFSVAAMVPNVLMMLLNIFYLHRLNRKLRIGLSLVFMLAIFVITTSLVLVDTESWTGSFFGITLFSVVFINICSAVLQGSVFGLAGMLPPRYTQAVMGGQGLSGLFAAVASILSQLGQNNVMKSAFGYFFTASAVLFICIGAMVVLFRLKFVKHYLAENRHACTHRCEPSYHDHLPDVYNEETNEKMQLKTKPKSTKQKSSLLIIIKQIFPMAFAVTITFLVTLACFPSITSRIISGSSEKNAWTDFFIAITCFLFFNLGDYLGRVLAGFIQIPRKRWPRWILPTICCARFIFIPLFIFCNAQPRSFPVVFKHDAFPAVFMLLFATSNGYFGSLGMMYGPSAVEGEHAELAGTVMACCISLGLGLGAVSSFLVTSFI
eukprot:gene13540-4426_t